MNVLLSSRKEQTTMNCGKKLQSDGRQKNFLLNQRILTVMDVCTEKKYSHSVPCAEYGDVEWNGALRTVRTV